jgi:CRISPR-associated protein Cmr3
MFKYLIAINPLGMMYGSSGGFLSPENLVGRSRSKFPPDAATLSGLFFSANKIFQEHNPQKYIDREELKQQLHVAGPFWSTKDNLFNLYIPIPWHKIISEEGYNQWQIQGDRWQLQDKEKVDIKAEYQWHSIDYWQKEAEIIYEDKAATKSPWQYVSVLHPKLKEEERHVLEEDGLFLENAVQMAEDICLVYLSTHELPNGWYRFGGENHIVEITSEQIPDNDLILEPFKQPIKRAFALITPGVWGSNQISYRYSQHESFPAPQLMLTDKPVPYRCRLGGRMGRGRYAVPPGSVYVLEEPLNKTWWEWSEDWFPREGKPNGISLKKTGCGLCLPIEIEGID